MCFYKVVVINPSGYFTVCYFTVCYFTKCYLNVFMYSLHGYCLALLDLVHPAMAHGTARSGRSYLRITLNFAPFWLYSLLSLSAFSKSLVPVLIVDLQNTLLPAIFSLRTPSMRLYRHLCIVILVFLYALFLQKVHQISLVLELRCYPLFRWPSHLILYVSVIPKRRIGV